MGSSSFNIVHIANPFYKRGKACESRGYGRDQGFPIALDLRLQTFTGFEKT